MKFDDFLLKLEKKIIIFFKWLIYGRVLIAVWQLNPESKSAASCQIKR